MGEIIAGVIDAVLNLSVVNPLFALVTLLPSIAVGVRRLHDTGRTGWWLLLGLIPLIGVIVLIIWFCYRGTIGTNRFGADPLKT